MLAKLFFDSAIHTKDQNVTLMMMNFSPINDNQNKLFTRIFIVLTHRRDFNLIPILIYKLISIDENATFYGNKPSRSLSIGYWYSMTPL